MSKVVLSVVLALGTVVVLVGGVMLGRDSGTSGDSTQLTPEVAGLRGELLAAREEIRAMAESIDGLRLSHERLSKDVRDTRTPVGLATVSAGDGAEGGAAPGLSVADLQGVVAAVLEEERRVKEEERDRQREESRERLEERRRELAALSEGPFDRYNLKINSLGNVLNMTEAQKQGYFELTTAYREKLEEGMKQLRESRKNAKAEDGGGEKNEEDGDERRGPGGVRVG